jgi:hypothetical protein
MLFAWGSERPSTAIQAGRLSDARASLLFPKPALDPKERRSRDESIAVPCMEFAQTISLFFATSRASRQLVPDLACRLPCGSSNDR